MFARIPLAGVRSRRALAALAIVAATATLAMQAQAATATHRAAQEGASGDRASAGGAARVCVAGKPGCFSTIQAAVDAAHDGDRITVGPGVFAGGVTIDKSVSVIGAGAGATIIRGGGPVVTIGEDGDPNPPTVSIKGVTITGGITSSAPSPDGPITFVGVGGGVYIPGGAPGSAGATVTIHDSVISGNQAVPSSTVDSGEPCPSGNNCLFAGGFGGGIADVGRLTLINTIVRDNVAGGGAFASDGAGGGIWTATNGGAGALTLIHSIVSGNQATVSAPNGRFAEGGGIQVQDGEAFVLKDSVVSGNLTSLSSSFPSGLEMHAGSAGIHIGGLGTATIEGSAITGNTSSVEDPNGSPVAVDAGLFDAGFGGQTLVLRNSSISGNRNIAHVASSADGLSGGALEIDGAATITNTRITGNKTSVSSSAGDAAAFGAVLLIDGEAQPILIANSSISGNAISASTSSGQATVFGAGIVNSGTLVLRRVKVSANVGTVEGPSGYANGGGIWNGQAFPDAPTPVLTLQDTSVTGNVLTGSPGLTLEGGGLFTPGFAIAVTSSVIARNTPDQCFGC